MNMETNSTLNVWIWSVCSSPPAGKYGIRPEDILLVHDELDKPLGKIAIKHGGSARLGFAHHVLVISGRHKTFPHCKRMRNDCFCVVYTAVKWSIRFSGSEINIRISNIICNILWKRGFDVREKRPPVFKITLRIQSFDPNFFYFFFFTEVIMESDLV